MVSSNEYIWQLRVGIADGRRPILIFKWQCRRFRRIKAATFCCEPFEHSTAKKENKQNVNRNSVQFEKYRTYFLAANPHDGCSRYNWR